jgi:alkylhydroperoxidase family enzyme
MPRLPYPQDVSAIPEGMAPLNIFRMLCHGPHLLKPFTGMGTAFLLKGTLDPVTRECVILRVGYLSKAPYEIAQHEAIGRAVGMSEALIDAVKSGPGAAIFTPEQRLAVAFTDHLVASPRPDDTQLDAARQHFGLAKLQELVLLIGYYMMVCRYLETFGPDIEDGGPAGAAIVS